MPGLYPRLHTWVAKEVLTYTDLNAEFDNIIAYSQASTLGGYSETVAQMQEQNDPGSVGSENLALSVAQELAELRFVIARIVGKTYWYEAPNGSLSAQALTQIGRAHV